MDHELWASLFCGQAWGLPAGWDPLLEGFGLAIEAKAWSDGLDLGTGGGCTLPLGGREAVEVLVEGCRFLCASPLSLPCERSLWLLARIQAIRGLREYSSVDCVAAELDCITALASKERMQFSVWVLLSLDFKTSTEIALNHYLQEARPLPPGEGRSWCFSCAQFRGEFCLLGVQSAVRGRLRMRSAALLSPQAAGAGMQLLAEM